MKGQISGKSALNGPQFPHLENKRVDSPRDARGQEEAEKEVLRTPGKRER